MTCHRICDQQRQPCPSAWHCEMGCNFTNATLETPRDKAARRFADMDMPIDMERNLGDEVIAWFQRWAWWIAGACFALAGLVTYFGRAV